MPAASAACRSGHYENNYGGAVKRLNLIDERLAELDFAAPGFLINGLKREWGTLVRLRASKDVETFDARVMAHQAKQ